MRNQGPNNDFVHVTEISGDTVSREQIERMITRYSFAKRYCTNRQVVELGCGSGQGLGYLAGAARTVIGGDYSASLLRLALNHYKGRIPLVQLDAQKLPIKDLSIDVVILFEAIYYLESPEQLVYECTRVLRPGGFVLLCNPNKDLPDFNPSPHSHRYFSAHDFLQLFRPVGFEVECFGDCAVDYGNPKQRFLSFVKRTMVRLDLMPKTMAGKKLFKRIVFGKLVPMPSELNEHDDGTCTMPSSIDSGNTDVCHKVIFAVAQKRTPL
ncbi:MAG: class I SAM-dependent methyltransferase [Desulfobacteraceae bacterium]|nr:MAG: class I SAM-dependent methyltransferase [Desulfobacteraceae bacterium]